MKDRFTLLQIATLVKLLNFSNKYEINIQFWPDQIAVYIEKGGVALQDYGGDFDFAVGEALKYLKRINKHEL